LKIKSTIVPRVKDMQGIACLAWLIYSEIKVK